MSKIKVSKHFFRKSVFTGLCFMWACENTVSTPPDLVAPANLQATAQSARQIDLAWTDTSNDENGFKLERRTANSNFSEIARIMANDTSYSDLTVEPAATYFFRIRASRGEIDSDYSDEVSATTFALPTTAPAAPSDLSAAGTSAQEITLHWQDHSDNEYGFDIERSLDGVTFAPLAATNSNIVTYIDGGLTPETCYTYRVRATNEAGDSAFSSSAAACTSANPIANPCTPNPCLNSGTCEDDATDFICHCSDNFTGNLCETSTTGSDIEAIAVWAFPDSVSIPYRDDNNDLLSAPIHIGVVAYHVTGIARVVFSVAGTDLGATVTNETVNPETNEYEYLFELDPSELGADGSYVVNALAYPINGTAHTLPDLILQKDTAAHDIHTASGGGTALHTACQAADDGDIIKVAAGAYNLPDQNYGFTKYVTIMPAAGVDRSAVVIGPGTIRTSFIKFSNVTFRYHAANDAVASNTGHHIWINGVRAIGAGCERPDNMQVGFRFYQTANFATVEYSELVDLSTGVVAGVASYPASKLVCHRYIVRQNSIYNMTDQGFGADGTDILATGNSINHTTREQAWSVSQADQTTYDFGTGQNLEFYHSTDSGTSWTQQATVTLNGALTVAQIVAVLNADSGFSARYSASVSAAPFPHQGRVRVETLTNTEAHFFYIAGSAQTVLRFSDNISYHPEDLNDISVTTPAKNGAQHCDFWQSNVGAINSIFRNNRAWDGMHQGVKWGGYNDGREQPFVNVALVNNQIALHPTRGSVNVRCQNRALGIRISNLLFEHNTVWNGSSIFIVGDTVDATNVFFINNIFGPKEVANHSNIDGITEDFNCYSIGGSGANSLVAAPLFIDATSWDFSLQTTSPAKGRATNAARIKYDLNWNLRNTSTPSIGAYE